MDTLGAETLAKLTKDDTDSRFAIFHQNVPPMSGRRSIAILERTNSTFLASKLV